MLLSSAVLVVAIVAIVGSFGRRHTSSLNEAEESLQVPRRLANLAADHDDRDGLARILNAGRAAAAKVQRDGKIKVQQQYQRREQRYGSRINHASKALTHEEVQEQHAKDINARVENAMMKTSSMVPWVRWPKSDDLGGSEFQAARKQQLLQMPMLSADATDNAAKVLPLSAIMNRLKVDSALHQGLVTDTQLAMADEAAHSKKMAKLTGEPHLKLDCKPFC